VVRKFRSIGRIRSAEVLQILTDEMNMSYTINQGKANCIGHILRRNCLLKHVIQGRIKGSGRRGRNHKHLLILEKKTLENEGGARLHSLENLLKKELRS